MCVIKLQNTAIGTRPHLHQRAGEGVEGSAGLDDGVVSGEGFELVGCRDERKVGLLGDKRRDLFVVTLQQRDSQRGCGACSSPYSCHRGC